VDLATDRGIPELVDDLLGVVGDVGLRAATEQRDRQKR
jgi:hypothetical protein